jgi:hypothetical protein
MSEENLPMRWDEELSKAAKEVASLERPALSQISLRSGQMTYMKQPVPGNKLTTIVLSSVFENKFFGSIQFDPDNYQAPICYALSSSDEDMVPHDDAKEKQSEYCSNCPQFQWGSATRAGKPTKGKACKQVRRLAIIPESVLRDGNIGSAELAVISIPVTSAKNWANYVNAIAGEYSRPPWGMLTEIRVEPDNRTQFQVKFKAVGTVADEYLGAIHKRIGSATDILLTPYDASGTVAGAPDPLPGRKY